MQHDLAMDPNMLTTDERRRRIVDLDGAVNEARALLRVGKADEALGVLDAVGNDHPGHQPITTVNGAFRSLREAMDDAA